MDLLQKLKSGTENHVIVKWPGTDDDVKIRVATEREYSNASLETDRTFKGRPIGIENAQAYSNSLASRILHTVISDPEKSTPIGTFKEFEGLLTTDAKACLDTIQEDLQETYSPDPVKLTPEELKTKIEDIKKKHGIALQDIGSMYIGWQLITSLANLLWPSQQDS
jgi:hypothetical protein